MKHPEYPAARNICFRPTSGIKGYFFMVLMALSTGNTWSQSKMSWAEAQRQSPPWYKSAEAQRIADNVLLYQNNNGGWLKNIDMANILSPSEVAKLKREKSLQKGTTIDNNATHAQMRYLAKVYQATGEMSYKESFTKGLDYLLEAQYDNGGWPQFYPLLSGYYDHITFNDDAMMGVMELLRDVVRQVEPYGFVDAERCMKTQLALDKGLELILKAQVKVDGKLRVWGAQHDKDDLSPAKARSYELASLSGKESVRIVQYLMGIENPDEKVRTAVRSAIQWFKDSKITNLEVIWKIDDSHPGGRDRVAVDSKEAGPLWARFYDIQTNTPIYVGRDGLVKFSLNDIEQERRMGYSYLGDYASELLERDYPLWEKKHGGKAK